MQVVTTSPYVRKGRYSTTSMPMRGVRAGPTWTRCFLGVFQLPVADATMILHNPVEIDAVSPRLCRGII